MKVDSRVKRNRSKNRQEMHDCEISAIRKRVRARKIAANRSHFDYDDCYDWERE